VKTGRLNIMTKKKDDTKLQKIVHRLLKYIATDAYLAGEGFEFEMVKQEVVICIEALPLPKDLKQVRGAIYQSKGKEDIKNQALQMVTYCAAHSAKLSDEVALYILSSTDNLPIASELAARADLSDAVREKAQQQLTS
jgi:hypothetical protein